MALDPFDLFNPTRRDLMLGASALGLASALPSRALAQSLPSAGDAVEALRDPILRMSREVWEIAEISLEEIKSADVLIREQRGAGFEIAGPGASGEPANFIAE